MDDRILTPEELVQVTGYKRPSAQAGDRARLEYIEDGIHWQP